MSRAAKRHTRKSSGKVKNATSSINTLKKTAAVGENKAGGENSNPKPVSVNKAKKSKAPQTLKTLESEVEKVAGVDRGLPLSSEHCGKGWFFKSIFAPYAVFFSLSVCLCAFFIVVFPGTIESGKEYEKEMADLDGFAKSAEMKYFAATPMLWGEMIDGVINRFDTEKKEVALTLDACGGAHGSGADIELIDFLIENKIKATLFLNSRWLAKNGDLFLKILSTGLFEVENHGFHHSPLSVTPREIYGIAGTNGLSGVAYEVAIGGEAIKKFTGKSPVFFRSGTAYYDDISLKILEDMGYRAVAFSVNADDGARLPADKVYKRMMKAKGGDIIIAHMNRPKGHTAEGMIKAIPKLQADGFEFIKLSEAKALKSEHETSNE